jgi:GTP cyclohydrolase I
MNQEKVEGLIKQLLVEIEGEEVANREGLQDTPMRAAKAYATWFSGYGKDAGELLKVFKDGAHAYDEMVAVVKIPFYSHCEHHIAMIIGEATVAYIPNSKDPRIVGLSKLNRLVDMFARRLQVQERLTTDIADALEEHLQPDGIGVYIKARHMCMESRGVQQQGHYTITSALKGVMKNDSACRAEFLTLAKS